MLEFSFIAADSKGVSVSRPARDPGRGVLPYIMYIAGAYYPEPSSPIQAL